MGEDNSDDNTPRVVMTEQVNIKPIVVSEEDLGSVGHLFNNNMATREVKPASTGTSDFDDLNAAIQRRKQQMQGAGATHTPGKTMVIPSQIYGKAPAPPSPLVPEKAPAPATKKCPSCNAELPVNAKFCNKCGYKF